MFPHTLTIYHHSVEAGTDVYRRAVVPGWYWMHTASAAGAGHGTQKTDTYTAVSSPLTASTYGKTWTVSPGDKAIKGEGTEITSWKDLQGDVMTVKAVEENICGSSVDNITLRG